MICKKCQHKIGQTALSNGYILYDVFPGDICVDCFEKKINATPLDKLEKPDFVGAIQKEVMTK